MRHLIFGILFFSCSLSFTKAQSQQDMMNIHLQGGIINNGFHVASGIERLFGKNQTNSLFLNLNYQRLDRSVSAVDMLLKEQNAFLNAGYRKYLSFSSHLLPYVGASVLAGYQHLGNAVNGIYGHKSTGGFLYGGGTHAGVEYRMKPFSIFLEGAYLYELDHSWLLGIGVKYYF